MQTSAQFTETQPSFFSAILFTVKSNGLKLGRGIKNFSGQLPRFRASEELPELPVIASSVSELWSNDTERNKILTTGKVQNLRVAAKRLNGVVVPGGSTFSFWAHVGKPSRGNGFEEGRELREGCIIPSVGGGLCQLSNALYDAALKAGFGIVERHRHSKVIPGSLAEKDRDATVFWNYIDLRFRSQHDFRIEIDMSATKLHVRFRGVKEEKNDAAEKTPLPQSHSLNDCLSCGVSSCFRSVDKITPAENRTAWLLEERWPEYERWMQENKRSGDALFLPLDGKRFRKATYAWKTEGFRSVKFATLRTLLRAWKLRRIPAQGKFLQAALLDGSKQLAAAYGRKLDHRTTHLVVSQTLLPFLHENFITAGRAYDVLMTRLPLFILHQRLSEAKALHPESETLDDFRAPEKLVRLEKEALDRAQRIITPHPEVAALYPAKAILLDWEKPERKLESWIGNEILFPASALGRKGAYELREAAMQLKLSLTVMGNATEEENFWGGVNVRPFSGDWTRVSLVVLPAFVEHQPRVLLGALAAGIPVIASKACGLEGRKGVTTVNAGDVEGLVAALKEQLEMGIRRAM